MWTRLQERPEREVPVSADIISGRTLTGRWYLKKQFFGYSVMVEVIRTSICEFDLSESPAIRRYEKATAEDIVSLGIPCG